MHSLNSPVHFLSAPKLQIDSEFFPDTRATGDPFHGILDGYSTGHAMQRITWFPCDCSSISLPALSIQQVSAVLSLHGTLLSPKTVGYMLRRFLYRPQEDKRGRQCSDQSCKRTLCNHIFEFMFLRYSLWILGTAAGISGHFISFGKVRNGPDVVLTVLFMRADKPPVFCGKIDAESCSLTEDTDCCFLVKLHLPQRCHQ